MEDGRGRSISKIDRRSLNSSSTSLSHTEPLNRISRTIPTNRRPNNPTTHPNLYNPNINSTTPHHRPSHTALLLVPHRWLPKIDRISPNPNIVHRLLRPDHLYLTYLDHPSKRHLTYHPPKDRGSMGLEEG